MTSDERKKALELFHSQGNPILRLWAAERLGENPAKLAALRREMLAHPPVRYWLECALAFPVRQAIHGSFDTCFENAMCKLLLFGVQEEDDPRLKELNDTVLTRLEHCLAHPNWLNPVEYTILASYLAAMGREATAVTETVLERLDSTLEFWALGGCDMYTDPKGFPSIPTARRTHPLISPEYYAENRYRFPLVYDLLAYANLPPALAKRVVVREKINQVVSIVLNEHYQRLPWGYGLLFIPPRSFYSMGWSVHLPGFFLGEGGVARGSLPWWLEAMSHFRAATSSIWFQNGLAQLETLRTPDGFWKIPAAYLPESTNKYAVCGGHMGLGEDRKTAAALVVESTAWLLRITESLESATS